MTIATYKVVAHTSASLGTGDSVNFVENNANDADNWKLLQLSFGRSSKTLIDVDLFLKFMLGPAAVVGDDDSGLSQVTIPADATINSAKLTFQAQQGQGTTPANFRAGLLKRDPPASQGSWLPGPDNGSWFEDSSDYSEFSQFQFHNTISLGGVVKSFTGTNKVPAPGASGVGVLRWDARGVSFDENVVEFAQENRITSLDGNGDAVFDSVEFNMKRSNTIPVGGETMWVEMYSAAPTGVGDYNGTLIGTSTAVLFTDYAKNVQATVSFAFTSTNLNTDSGLGTGAKTVWSILKTDATEWFFGAEQSNSANAIYKSRILGKGSGFGAQRYPSQVMLPHISPQTTDTLNTNLFGSATVFESFGSWVTDASTDHFETTLGALVAAWIVDGSYVEGESIGIVIERKAEIADIDNVGVLRTAHSTNNLGGFDGPILTIDFTPLEDQVDFPTLAIVSSVTNLSTFSTAEAQVATAVANFSAVAAVLSTIPVDAFLEAVVVLQSNMAATSVDVQAAIKANPTVRSVIKTAKILNSATVKGSANAAATISAIVKAGRKK